MTSTIEHDVKLKWEELKALRDEIRVGLHLAGMDLRDEWAKIERRIPEVAQTIEDLKTTAGDTVDRAVIELKAFRDRLRKG